MILSFESFSLTLSYHDVLNPAIWEDENCIKKDVRQALLKIADAWQVFAKIPDSAIHDIIFTGGNANYNYTSFSDLDVHLIIDKSKVSSDLDLLDEYFQDKKTLWAMKHPDISVKGYPVELYAQGINDPISKNAGVYSLKHNKWVKVPVHEHIKSFDSEPGLKSKVQMYMRTINKIIKSPGDHSAELDVLKTKIHGMRAAAIASGGEYSFENLIFKELRNRGYIDKIKKYITTSKDKLYTLEKD